MNLLKTSALSAIAAFVKIITLFFLNKILAIYIGPTGFATVGKFQNFSQVITTLGNLGFNTGVTKLTAQYSDVHNRQAIWSSVCKITFFTSLLLGFLIVVFGGYFSHLIFNSKEFWFVFVVFGVCLPLITMNFLLLSCINGIKAVKNYVLSNILGNLFSFIVISIMVFKLNLFGALVGLACHQALGFFVTLKIIKKNNLFSMSDFLGPLNLGYLKRIIKFSSLALTSGVVMAFSMIVVREIISDKAGLEAAGYWDAMWRFSATYLLFTTMTLKVYLLPQFASFKSVIQVRRELQKILILVLPVGIISSYIIYINKSFILTLLFTEAFLPAQELFLWQLVGDVLKVISWIFAFILIAKERFKELIILELVFCCIFPISVKYLITDYGFEAASIGYSISYLIHLLLTLFLLIKFKLV